MNNVLVDTSAWIDFFRTGQGEVGDIVANLIRADKAFLAGPIMAELLHGVRGKKETVQLENLFSTVPCLNVEEQDWISSGKILQKLRGKGIPVPLTDVLIAQVARRNKMMVLTLGKHFQHLSVPCVEISKR